MHRLATAGGARRAFTGVCARWSARGAVWLGRASAIAAAPFAFGAQWLASISERCEAAASA